MKRSLALMIALLTAVLALVAGCTQAPQAAQMAAPPIQTLAPAARDDLKLTILYDNTAIDPRLKSGWGYAALVEYGGHTLLFDTGPSGDSLMNNLQQLGVDPKSVEAVVLSHDHSDHTAGLIGLTRAGTRPTVYRPIGFGSRALEIVPGVHTTRLVGAPAGEQALVVEARDGTVVLTGCAHPGVATMVREAQAVVPGKVALLAGGFHLYETDKNKLPPIIAELRQLGVERVMPAHCTGDAAVSEFGTVYGENSFASAVGRTVTSTGKGLIQGEGSLHWSPRLTGDQSYLCPHWILPHWAACSCTEANASDTSCRRREP